MAVTLTVAQLAAALRFGDAVEETAEATRLLAFASEAVTKHAPDAPDVAHDEAAIRMSGYLADQPNAGRGVGYAHAGRNSGAFSLLLPYRIHRAGSTGEAVQAAQDAVGSLTNPVTDVTTDTTAGTLTVTFADGTTRTEALPAGMGEMFSGTDQTARDAAAAAQSTADTALEAAPAPTELGTASLSIETAATFHSMGITLPAGKTWAYVSMGAHTEQVLPDGVAATYAPGPWQRFLISDLLGLPDITTTTTPDAENAVHTEVELQNFRELDIGTSTSGEMFASIPHKNANTTIAGPLRVWVA